MFYEHILIDHCTESGLSSTSAVSFGWNL